MSIEEIIKQALLEDIGNGDHTTCATIPPGLTGTAKLLVKDKGIICGVELARQIFHHIDNTLVMNIHIPDGNLIKPGDIVFTVTGSRKSILSSERLVLNFMQRLSGIATATRELVDLTGNFPAKILDTRKTTPLLRELEKYAVRTGGGENHRMGLYDMIMIKDNHIDFAGGIPQAIDAVHEYLKTHVLDLKIEIEVRSFDELSQVISHGGVNRIMLDNFSPENLQKAIRLIDRRFETEASGGITKTTIADFAATGVDFISVGALTHHIKSLDLSLKVTNTDL